MIFTEAEIQYITTQRLGRLATVRADSTPQVNPVSCYYNPNTDTIDIGGHDLASSQKYRNVRINPATAVVIDDMPNTDPKGIRCLELASAGAEAQACRRPFADRSAGRRAGRVARCRRSRIVRSIIKQEDSAMPKRYVVTRAPGSGDLAARAL